LCVHFFLKGTPQRINRETKTSTRVGSGDKVIKKKNTRFYNQK